jgi:post-segregation antitoxin (ccd killing protein)
LVKEEKKRITFSITSEMDKKLRQEAKKRGLSVSTVVTLALEEYWKSGK